MLFIVIFNRFRVLISQNVTIRTLVGMLIRGRTLIHDTWIAEQCNILI